jgi:hypothetical protein
LKWKESTMKRMLAACAAFMLLASASHAQTGRRDLRTPTAPGQGTNAQPYDPSVLDSGPKSRAPGEYDHNYKRERHFDPPPSADSDSGNSDSSGGCSSNCGAQ